MLTDFVVPVAELALCLTLMVMAIILAHCLRFMNAPHECCAKCGHPVSACDAVMSRGVTYCPKCAAMLVDEEEGQ